ncbi:MAG: hypothetical protein JSR46_05570 [Verrucomicrobia bacterium]|nr:hypothetical protein [Verrucomicrobiota bacterium]
MPFITIEIPDSCHFSLQPFALELNQYLSEALEVPIEKCKIKLIRLSEWCVGKGSADDAYARLKVEFMGGRDRQKLVHAGEELVRRFEASIQSQNQAQPCRITVDFHELDRELLFVANSAPRRGEEEKRQCQCR